MRSVGCALNLYIEFLIYIEEIRTQTHTEGRVTM